MGTDPCHDTEGLVAEYALGERCELEHEQYLRVQKHLSACAGCQQALADMEALGHCLCSQTKTVLPLGYARIQSSLQVGRDMAAANPCQRWWRHAAAAAGLVVLGLAIWHVGTGVATTTPESQQPLALRPVDQHGRTEATGSQVQGFGEGTDAAAGLKLLRDKFDRARTGSGDDLARILAMCDELAERWPDSDQVLDAMRLTSECYTQMAEHEKSQLTFLAYAEAAAGRLAARGQEEEQESAGLLVSRIIKKEADRHFGRKDYLSAIACYDVILTRYPHLPAATSARLKIAAWYALQGQPEQARSQYKTILASNPTRPVRRAAERKSISLLINTRRYEQGADFIDARLSQAETPSQRAQLHYARSLLAYGARDVPLAISKLRQVKSAFSESAPDVASQASCMMAMINSEMLDRVLLDSLD